MGRIVSRQVERSDHSVRVTVVDDKGNIGQSTKVSGFLGLAETNSTDEAVATSRAISQVRDK